MNASTVAISSAAVTLLLIVIAHILPLFVAEDPSEIDPPTAEES